MWTGMRVSIIEHFSFPMSFKHSQIGCLPNTGRHSVCQYEAAILEFTVLFTSAVCIELNNKTKIFQKAAHFLFNYAWQKKTKTRYW